MQLHEFAKQLLTRRTYSCIIIIIFIIRIIRIMLLNIVAFALVRYSVFYCCVRRFKVITVLLYLS